MPEMLLHDLRHAFRTLRRTKLSTGVTIFTLALGIGVVTAIFALIDAVLLDPIASDQHRLIRVWKHDVERDLARAQIAYFEFTAWRERARSFESLAAILYSDAGRAAITIEGRPTPVAFTLVSSNFFDTLHKTPPLLGRWLRNVDDEPGADLVAVVSEGFWRRMAGRDPCHCRASVHVQRRSHGARRWCRSGHTGISNWHRSLMPIPSFFDGKNGRFDANTRRTWLFELIGRLAEGVSAEQARAELAVLHRQLSAQFPQDYRVMQIVVQPLVHAMVGHSRQALWFLFAGAGLVFLIAVSMSPRCC